MNDERTSRSRAEEVFHTWLDLDRSGDSPPLDELLGDQPETVAAEVRRMVSDYNGLREKLGSTEFALASGRSLGPFRLVREIGRGGMGVIWEAEQEGLARSVALKILHPQFGISDESLVRFRREAEAYGRLQHPAIVAIYTVGEADGLHYIAEELVGDGYTMADWLAEMREASALPEGYYSDMVTFLADVAEALDAAHAEGVIHRDVKPSNVLVASDGKPKVADFGLALMHDSFGVSHTGQLVGTTAYMSPEQVASKRMGIDHRTDVFSLGVTMYEALTLRRPFDGDTRHQLLQQILVEDPPDPHTVRSRCPDEIAHICMMALEKNPERRYPTAGALAADLRRWLAHEPVSARPPGVVRRISKWIRRHPILSSSAALVLAALGVISFLLVQKTEAERRALANEVAAKAAEKESRAAYVRANASEAAALRDVSRLAVLSASQALIEGDPVRAYDSLAGVPQEHRGWEWNCVASRLEPADRVFWGHATGVSVTRFDREGRRVLSGDFEGRVVCWNVSDGSIVWSIQAHPGLVSDISMAPDEKHVVTVGEDGLLKIWKLADGQLVRELPKLEVHAGRVGFDDLGDRVMLAGKRGLVCYEWDALLHSPSGMPGRLEFLHEPGGDELMAAAAFGPSGRNVAFASGFGTYLTSIDEPVESVSAVHLSRALDVSQHRGRRVSVSARLAVTEGERDARVDLVVLQRRGKELHWKLDSTRFHDQRPIEGHRPMEHHLETRIGDDVHALDIRIVLLGRVEAWIDSLEVHVIDEESGARTLLFEHEFDEAAAGWKVFGNLEAMPRRDYREMPDGARGTILRSDPSGMLGLHGGLVRDVAMSRDGQRLAVLGVQGEMALWDTQTRARRHDLSIEAGVLNCGALSPHGSTLIVGTAGGAVYLFDADRGVELGRLSWAPHAVWSLEFAPGGERVVAGFADGAVRVFDLPRRRLNTASRAPLPVVYANGDGSRIAGLEIIAGTRGAYATWLLETRRQAYLRWRPTLVADGPCDAVSWNLATGSRERHLTGTGVGGAAAVALAKDADRTAAGLFVGSRSTPWEVRVFGGDDFDRPLHVIPASSRPMQIALSADGEKLAFGSLNSVELVDLTTNERASLATSWTARSLAFGPEGDVLFVGSADGRVSTWRLWPRASHPDSEFQAHRGKVVALGVSPDGRRLATAGNEGAVIGVKLWKVPELLEIELSPSPGTAGVEHQPSYTNPFAYVDQGRRLVVAKPSRLLAYDTSSGELTLTLDPQHVAPIAGIDTIQEDGQPESLLIAGSDRTIEVMRFDSVASSEWFEDPARVAEHVDALFDEHWTRRDVAAALLADDSLTSGFRDAALRVTSRRGDDYDAFYIEAFQACCRADRTEREYRRALEFAELGLEVSDGARRRWLVLTGMARYRMGQWQAALDTLQVARTRFEKDRPIECAFTSMAYSRLGDATSAREWAHKIEPARANPVWRDDRRAEAVAAEAQRLILELPETSRQRTD